MFDNRHVDNSICNNAALKKASRYLNSFYDDALAPCGLRSTQYAVLYHINRIYSPSMTELASVLVTDRSALSHTMRPLLREGIVELSPSSVDRRIKTVRLSAEGQRRFDEAQVYWQNAQAVFEINFGGEEAVTLRNTLDGMINLRLRLKAAGPARVA